jgi:exopolysaccharide biosynthesis polyprenyl glycosylphosphotransferase
VPVGTPHRLDKAKKRGILSIEASNFSSVSDTAGAGLSVNQLAKPPPTLAGLRTRLIIVDATAAAIAWSLSLFAGATSHYHGGTREVLHISIAVCAMVICTVGLSSWTSLYRGRVCAVRSLEIAGLLRVSAIGGASATAVAAIVHLHLPWQWAVSGVIVMFVGDSTMRGIFARWLRGARASGRFYRNVVLVGDNDEALDLYNLTRHHPECGLRVVGVVSRPGGRPVDEIDAPWLGSIDDLPNAVDFVDGVIVAVSSFSTVELNRAVRVLLGADVHIQLSTGLTSISHQRIRPLPLARHPMVYVEPQRHSGAQQLGKRVLDLVGATTLLVLGAPILAVAALAIKLGERTAPIIYTQERVGRGGQPFTIYKLRTMVPDAAAHLENLRALNQRSGPLFKVAHDPRVTAVGRFLRRTSIDELPQLINVLKGEMSLVGPRPALASEVELFDSAHLARQNVLPGVTGLWQVEGRNNPSFFAYRSLDLFYLENWTLLLDVAIICATVIVIVGSALRPLTSLLRRTPNSDLEALV